MGRTAEEYWSCESLLYGEDVNWEKFLSSCCILYRLLRFRIWSKLWFSSAKQKWTLLSYIAFQHFIAFVALSMENFAIMFVLEAEKITFVSGNIDYNAVILVV